ncbi:MAG: hypothetical protein K6U09_09710 [Acidobacteriia bacterium]|jgi:hypothetical protein|nr:hypothetical protein [Terriglobia bacterium]
MRSGNGLVGKRTYNARSQPTQMGTNNPSQGQDTRRLICSFNYQAANNEKRDFQVVSTQ